MSFGLWAGHAVAADPVILGHTSFGQGNEKVLVLHDWMGDASNYEPMIQYLDPRTFTYVFADLRGYGESSQYQGTYSVEEASADVFALADTLGWSEFHVVGHSMSGMIVQRMAIDDWKAEARRLKSVVAITPIPANGYELASSTQDLLRDMMEDASLAKQGFALLSSKRLFPTWGKKKTVRHFETRSRDVLEGYYRMWLETDFSAEALAGQSETPMRVIGGHQDLPPFQAPKYAETFEPWYPNVDVVDIAQAGHFPMKDRPEQLANQIEEFLCQRASLPKGKDLGVCAKGDRAA